MARRKTGIQGPQYFTTFQVAKLLGVSPPAVVNWVNQDLLKAHRTPGGHRRIAQHELVRFANEHHYPLPEDLRSTDAASNWRVLVVDDEEDFCDMVREYLTIKGGFNVEVATSGFGAGLTVARFQPHVILMDIMMPDMDGFEVLQRLRSDPSTRAIPVIACTAFRDPVMEKRIQSENFDRFVQKPLKLDELLDVILSLRPEAEALEA
ncbi:MAG: response regulator [Pseudomonadota bacterium]